MSITTQKLILYLFLLFVSVFLLPIDSKTAENGSLVINDVQGIIIPFSATDVDFNFSWGFDSKDTLGEVSGTGRFIGGIFLTGLAAFSFISFIVLVLFLIFRWGKFGGCGKAGLLGCSIISFIAFLGSAISAIIIFYYLYKEKSSSKTNAEYEVVADEKIVNSSESSISDAISEKRTMSGDELGMFAREKFNNAVKLYEEYQKSLDPEVYKRGLLEIESAIQADGSKSEYYFLAGKMYSEVAPDYTVQIFAEEYLRKSLELDPKNIQAVLTLANCLSLQERYYEAGELFMKALTMDYYRLRDYLVPIITYTYIYDYQASKGEKFLRKLLENDPDSQIIRICLAIVMNKQGATRADEAKNELKKVINRADTPLLLKTYASNLLKNFDKWHDRRYSDEE